MNLKWNLNGILEPKIENTLVPGAPSKLVRRFREGTPP